MREQINITINDIVDNLSDNIIFITKIKIEFNKINISEIKSIKDIRSIIKNIFQKYNMIKSDDKINRKKKNFQIIGYSFFNREDYPIYYNLIKYINLTFSIKLAEQCGIVICAMSFPHNSGAEIAIGFSKINNQEITDFHHENINLCEIINTYIMKVVEYDINKCCW